MRFDPHSNCIIDEITGTTITTDIIFSSNNPAVLLAGRGDYWGIYRVNGDFSLMLLKDHLHGTNPVFNADCTSVMFDIDSFNERITLVIKERTVDVIYSIYSPDLLYREDSILNFDGNTTCVSVIRNSDEHTIFQYERSTFAPPEVNWFTRKGHLWYCSGRRHMHQLFIDLTTQQVFDPPVTEKESFCWSTVKISKCGDFLIVDGCYWAMPSWVNVYDFRDPSKGWPLVCESADSDCEITISDNIIHINGSEQKLKYSIDSLEAV